jgi:hypothetical protein
MPIDKMQELLKTLQDLDKVTKQNGFLENDI